MATPKRFNALQRGYKFNYNWHTPFLRFLNFEGKSAGSKAQNSDYNSEKSWPDDCFDTDAGGSLYSDLYAVDGSQCGICRTSTSYPDPANVGYWGGNTYFHPYRPSGSKLYAKRGDTLNFGAHIRFAPDFDFTADGGGRLKFLRFKVLNADMSVSHHVDLYLANICGGVHDEAFAQITEGVPDPVRKIGDSSINPQPDTWEYYEMSITFDTRHVEEGGQAKAVVWNKDGVIGTVTDQRTMESEDQIVQLALLFSNWNHNVPANQSMYVDAITITNLAGVDFEGNSKIGALV